MATDAFVALYSTTLATATATTTVSGIPPTYRDLYIVVSSPQAANTSLQVRFNSDSSSNYSWIRMYGDGSTTGSSVSTSNTFIYPGDLGPGRSLTTLNIFDYSAVDKQKTALGRSNVPGNYVFTTASRWASNAAVNTVAISGSSSLEAGTSIAVYGIKA